jgi:hypothetical protein
MTLWSFYTVDLQQEPEFLMIVIVGLVILVATVAAGRGCSTAAPLPGRPPCSQNRQPDPAADVFVGAPAE